MERLRTLIDGNDLIVAPVALNPLMARMAVEAGFKAVYMSGGSLGWVKCNTEATITLPEMVDIAIDMRTVSDVPIVLDAGGGWGDPAHIHRTIKMTEAAGFDAIEIEDQLLPRRFHHHVGIEHLVPADFMVSKIREAVAARRDPNLIIIGRTNSLRIADMDDALRRSEAYKAAGADMLFIHTRNPEEMRIIGERLPPPLMIFAPEDGFAVSELSPADLAGLGFRLAASSGSAFVAMYKAVRQSYECLANGTIDPLLGKGGTVAEMRAARVTAGLDELLEIEKRTMGED
ncbi:MAG: isocitrate lyase/PEP mutase family protein [Proteobacteria bacterium]|nr:isocitrate lyase/PEP mutase family protein [Pseudomonadota bacterium]